MKLLGNAQYLESGERVSKRIQSVEKVGSAFPAQQPQLPAHPTTAGGMQVMLVPIARV